MEALIDARRTNTLNGTNSKFNKNDITKQISERKYQGCP